MWDRAGRIADKMATTGCGFVGASHRDRDSQQRRRGDEPARAGSAGSQMWVISISRSRETLVTLMKKHRGDPAVVKNARCTTTRTWSRRWYY
jgi:hypothetical protein